MKVYNIKSCVNYFLAFEKRQHSAIAAIIRKLFIATHNRSIANDTILDLELDLDPDLDLELRSRSWSSGLSRCCRSGMFILDPESEFFHPGSRVKKISDPDPYKRI
jgi:hypothetical protein